MMKNNIKKHILLPFFMILIICCLTGCSTNSRSDIKDYLNELEVFQDKSNTYSVSFFKTKIKTINNDTNYVWTINANINNEQINFYVIEKISYGGGAVLGVSYLHDTYNYNIMQKALHGLDLKSFSLVERTDKNYSADDNIFINKHKIEELNHSGYYILKSSFNSLEEFNKKINELSSIIDQTSRIWKPTFEIEMDDVNEITKQQHIYATITNKSDLEDFRKEYIK